MRAALPTQRFVAQGQMPAPGLKLNGDWFADRLERLQVEVDADRDFLSEKVLGYSP